jgi:hypothetical protein
MDSESSSNKCKHGVWAAEKDRSKNPNCSICTPILIPKETDREKIIVLTNTGRWRSLEDMQEKDFIVVASRAIIEAVPTPAEPYVLVPKEAA